MGVGDLYGTSIDTLDPFFGALTDDRQILVQAATLALGTAYGSLPEFHEYGFDWDSYILKPLTADQRARLPEDVRAALEQEARFRAVDVSILSETSTGTGGVALALGIDITPADGSRLSFTLGVTPTAAGGVDLTDTAGG